MNYVVAIVIGLVVGSFLTALQNRLGAIKWILYDRSRCTKCNHVLGVLDLFPILSFVFLRGKCRYCKKKISPIYPAIELIAVALALFSYHFFGFSWQSVVLFFCLCALLLASIEDIKAQEVDILIFVIGIALTFVWRLFMWCDTSTLYDVLIGGIVTCIFPLCLALFSKEKWMGYGDSFFAFWIGVLCGFPLGLIGIFLAFLLGSIFGIMILIREKQKEAVGIKIPFGPFIALGGVAALVYGAVILDNYLRLLGY
jgi:prepilin signal peptidase PulO-like enzyme (type II secretory pathway)